MSSNGLEVKEIFKDEAKDAVTGSIGLFHWLAGANDLIPAWWSTTRDIALRRFWKEEDHLAGTVATLREMMTAIPFQIVARDNTIKSHVTQAEAFTRLLLEQSESRSNPAARGWGIGYGAFIEDYHTQDNGAILAIEGPGRPDGPLTGPPTKLIHLDSFCCQRTTSREYPIIFTDTDGRRYKLHHSRVVVMASMSSPAAEMCGVGFCPVSRALQTAQHLKDIARYKMEKLGSRPRRGLLIGKGIPTKAIEDALALADESMDNMGLTRYAKVPIIGSAKNEIDLTLIDLASLPDGYDEMQSTQLGMAVLALAFGVDTRQLAFALGVAGVTKADAVVQHLKMRGKGPGYIIQEVERQFNAKVVPPYLKLEFDYQDDEADQIAAQIADTRSQRRERDIGSGVVSIRVAREQMVADGDLIQAQFEQLELADNRLPEGDDVLTLFVSRDSEILRLLAVGVDNPLDVAANDAALLIPAIDRQLTVARERAINATTANLKSKARQAAAALEKLRGWYQAPAQQEMSIPVEKSIKTKQHDVPQRLAEYEAELTDLIEQAGVGKIEQEEFESQVEEITTAALVTLFLLGSGSQQGELDEEQQQVIDAEINLALSSIPALSADVYSGAFLPVENGGKGNSLAARVALWGGFAYGLYQRAKTFQADDPFLRWDVGQTQHCADCKRLNGQVHRASKWRDSGWYPGARHLSCTGRRCQCSLNETSGPSRGNF